jgi:hypothetical protein
MVKGKKEWKNLAELKASLCQEKEWEKSGQLSRKTKVVKIPINFR